MFSWGLIKAFPYGRSGMKIRLECPDAQLVALPYSNDHESEPPGWVNPGSSFLVGLQAPYPGDTSIPRVRSRRDVVLIDPDDLDIAKFPCMRFNRITSQLQFLDSLSGQRP